MIGVNSLLDMGIQGLFASQMSIQVTGNNIANVNTPGYSRQTLLLEESLAIDYNPGQIGTGVTATEIIRHFDTFIEATYNDKASDMERWQSLYENLRGIDSLFNEAAGNGLNQALNQFFADWQDLTIDPTSYPTRESLLLDTQNLLSVMRQSDSYMTRMQEQADQFIQQDVNEVNELLRQIASVNDEINLHEVEGENNPNSLYDKRALLVRELATKMDIKSIDNGKGNLIITTQAGHTLVDGHDYYKLAFESSQATRELTSLSTYTGEVAFDGADEFEYMLKVVHDGVISSNASDNSVARFAVSFDGGRTWDMGDDGKGYLARTEDNKITVRNVEIGFTVTGDPARPELDTLAENDIFTIVPKKGLYWYQNTSSKENITPLMTTGGQDDATRITGGTLTGYFNFRDASIGSYRDKLDAMARSIIWDVNRYHTQGAGLESWDSLTGTYTVKNENLALGSNTSGLVFHDRLASGNAMIYIYDADTGNYVSSATLDFSDDPGIQNFDPGKHSLASCAAAINRSFGGSLTASVLNNSLHIESEDGYTFAMGEDSTGLWAGLGLNTFFEGTRARDIDISSQVANDPGMIATGHVNGAGEFNPGDNTTSVNIAGLADEKVAITTLKEGTQLTSLLDFYNTIVSDVGADTASANFNFQYNQALATDLDERQQEVAGVNLDEEMANLVKFQHSYTAAAKLITVANEMLDTLLSLKN